MKFSSPISVPDLAKLIEAIIIGNESGMVTGINEIHKVEPGDVVFVDHPKYYDKCIQSAASFIIIDKVVDDIPEGKALLVHAQPFEAYQKIVRHFRPLTRQEVLINPTASIGAGSY